MFPSLDPKKMQEAMKRLGIKQEQIDAKEVIIKCSDKNLIVRDPNVSKVNISGQEMLQITGKIETLPEEISEQDIETVMSQAKVGKEKAVELLKKTEGDIAKAIMLSK